MTFIRREELAEGIVLYQGDCREVLPGLGKVDAVCSDPPYGISYVHGADKSRFASKFTNTPIAGDDEPFDPSVLIQCPCVLWGANHFAQRLPGGGAGLSGINVTALASMTSLMSRLLG